MRHLIVFIGIFGLFAIFGPSVNACSCASPGTPCESYGHANAVFVGTVTGVSTEKRSKNETGWTPLAFKFAVEHSYLGVEGTEVEVFTGRGGGDCGFGFAVGKRYLVYAYRSENRLSTSICSRTTAYARATEDLAFLGNLSSAPKGATIYGQIIRGTPRKKEVPALSEDTLVKIEGEGVRREILPDADGRYRIAGLPPGKYKIALQLPDTLTVNLPEREVSISDRGCASQVFYVEDNGRLSGKVIDAEGQPVARILVTVLDPSSDPRGPFLNLERTDAEGRFSFSAIPAGKYLLGVNFTKHPQTNDPTNAYAPTFYPGVADQSSAEVITLGVGEKRTDLDILVPLRRPLSVVNGRIVWEDGSPVTAASLTVVDLTYGGSSLRNGLEVDQQGRFTLNGYVGQKLRFEARSNRPYVQSPTNEPMESSKPVDMVLYQPTETVTIVITKLR
jgi:Carboxypeptidase regulatory-like domain